MKKSIFVLILGLLLSSPLLSQENIQYPIQTGSVEYVMSMMGSENYLTMYFKDHGNTQCSEAKISLFGINKHTRTLINGKKVSNLDMDAKTYSEVELTDEELKKQARYLSDESVMKEEGITKDGEEEFLGKTCQVYSMSKDGADIKFWSWKGLMLKMETTAQGMSINLIAKSISEEAPNEDFFAIPDDFTKVEIPENMENPEK